MPVSLKIQDPWKYHPVILFAAIITNRITGWYVTHLHLGLQWQTPLHQLFVRHKTRYICRQENVTHRTLKGHLYKHIRIAIGSNWLRQTTHWEETNENSPSVSDIRAWDLMFSWLARSNLSLVLMERTKGNCANRTPVQKLWLSRLVGQTSAVPRWRNKTLTHN